MPETRPVLRYAEVYVEFAVPVLDRPFTYACDEYLRPGMRVEVPFGHQKLTGMVFALTDQKPEGDFEIRRIERVIDESPVLNEELLTLAKTLSYDNIAPVMTMVRTMLPVQAQARTARKKPVMAEWLLRNKEQMNENSLAALTKRQKEIFMKMEDETLAAAARKTFSPGILRILIEKGYLIREYRIKRFPSLAPRPQKPWHALNAMQENALAYLRQDSRRVRLLHGMTGSGKTEVFFHLVKDALEKNKQVLILVPEISLTPMMLNRFLERFTVPVYACHSMLSDAQHLDLHDSIAAAGPCIVIGTRKSVFLPFSELGLIIMDEEHDGSYKQDQGVCYHARDAAVLRAEYHDCPLILASATPSLETYARAVKGVYALASLPARAAGANAAIRLVDLKKERAYANLSETLIRAVQNRLKVHEKSLILLNRRGYLPTVRCTECKEFLECEDCGLPLSYHRSENALVCHVCGRRYPVIRTCPKCGSSHLSQTGQGTERLEEDIEGLFPNAVIVRMDRDTTRRKGAHAKLLEDFETRGDILMGTQMISKGLDYEDITLAAVLSADMMLARPDYRSAENAYQLMEQAAGRSGRGKKPGEVIIQTFNPDHYVYECIIRHDYRAFFVREMAYRHIGFYPPYSYMAVIVFVHEDGMAAWRKAEEVKVKFGREGIRCLGPMDISMRVKKHRVRLILKEKSDDQLKRVLWQFQAWFTDHADGCRTEINVHPMSLEE